MTCLQISNYDEISQQTNFANDIFKIHSQESYVTIAGCLLEYIIKVDELVQLEKIFYILANSLAFINFRCNKERSIALSADSWAKRLNCSRSKIFAMQKSLEAKNYFIVFKNKNLYGQNNRNLIYPTIPDQVFKYLCASSSDRTSKDLLPYVRTQESKCEYLDRTKLFIRINYNLLKNTCSSDKLTPFCKVIWLDFYVNCYKKYIALKSEEPTTILSFITSTIELIDIYSYDKRHISRTLINLEKAGFIKRDRFYIKQSVNNQSRQDKSLWKITLLLPSYKLPLEYNSNKLSYETDKLSLVNSNKATVKLSKCNIHKNKLTPKTISNVSSNDRNVANSNLHRYNKYFILKDRSANTNKTLLSCNNQSNSIDFDSKYDTQEIIKIPFCKLKHKRLLEFYPVSAADIPILQQLSGREFDLNATNQILRSIARKKTGYTFPNKQAFISYMSLILKHELRQAVQVNNGSFKIKANETESERENKEIEQYLSKIEGDFSDISNQAKLKKKLAATLPPRTAYQLLQSIKHMEFNDYILTITTNRAVELKPLDQQIILNQARVVYGDDLAVKYQLQTPNSKAKKIENDTNREVCTQTQRQRNSVNELRGEWGQIRQSLILYYGEAIDKSWFAKLEQVSVDETTNAIMLKAPTGFIRDYINSHYLAMIDSFAQKLFAEKIWHVELMV